MQGSWKWRAAFLSFNLIVCLLDGEHFSTFWFALWHIGYVDKFDCSSGFFHVLFGVKSGVSYWHWTHIQLITGLDWLIIANVPLPNLALVSGLCLPPLCWCSDAQGIKFQFWTSQFNWLCSLCQALALGGHLIASHHFILPANWRLTLSAA
jgi:hypothetical protein